MSNIQIFSDKNDDRYTFEKCIYDDNRDVIASIQKKGKEIDLNYMLNNKSEMAFKLLTEKGSELIVPQYIIDAIKWIDE